MIQVEHVTKRFEAFTALDDLSCVIREGGIYGLVGANGAGKSTFLRLAAGVYRPDAGSVMVDAEAVYDNPSAKGRIAFVSDSLFFLPQSNLERMILLYESVYTGFDRKRCQALTKLFGLDAKKPISTFSKGMRRQAAVILALSCNANYVFFDETFDGLDPVMRRLLKDTLYEDVISRGRTAVVTSHSLRELEDTCDQLALLYRGGLVLESDVDQLKTSLFKLQTAFRDEFDKSRFEGLDILSYEKRGSVASLILRGDKAAALRRMNDLGAILAEALPLTLEEVFLYEMEVRGYSLEGLKGEGGEE